MTLKLGGELELVDVDVRTSTLVARKLFLNLIWDMKPEVVIDLVRLFNIESIPAELKVNPNPIDFSAKVFLLHTKFHHCYSIDLNEFGYKPDVRQTPVLAYFDFIFRNQKEFDELWKKSEAQWEVYSPNASDQLITESALEEFIPDWKSLQSRTDSDWLCSELIKWAEKWNLQDEWCLDFALDCLREFKVKLIDEIRLPDDYLNKNDISPLFELNRFWNRGMAWHYSLWDFGYKNMRDFMFTNEIPDYPQFKYSWEIATEEETQEIFTVEGHFNPLAMFPEDFRRKVEEQFWSGFFGFFAVHKYSFVGNNKQLLDELAKFQKGVDDYISKTEELIKPFAVETIRKKSGDRHFRWLIEYQISPVKSYNELAKENNVDRRHNGWNQRCQQINRADLTPISNRS
jgi:hypothetical protein